MKKIRKKSKRVAGRLGHLAELKQASLSARDPVAFSAALQVLG
jgi:hypothetical protein